MKETCIDERRFKRVCFSCLPDTWRITKSNEESSGISTIAKGKLLSYLNPVPLIDEDDISDSRTDRKEKDVKYRSRRVIDRPDIKQLLIPGL